MSDTVKAPQNRGKNLPTGYCLHEYEITETLGAGGFGITYLARDRNLDKAVAIKEFFPLSFATRYPDDSIGPVADTSSMGTDYSHLLGRFIDEARTLAKFEHPNVLRVLRYFEANNTAYIIMEYVAGPTLLKRVQEKQLLDEAELRPILLALIDGLKAVHGHSMLHRDIKPENIVLRNGKLPVLIDFGASREAIGRRGHSVTMMWTPGYAPIEQMSDSGQLGPWSDIYALGATAYMALVGAPPGDSAARIVDDRIVPAAVAAKGRASEQFLQAIDWAIRPWAKDRPQDVDAWLAAFDGAAIAPSSADAKTVVMARGNTTVSNNPASGGNATVVGINANANAGSGNSKKIIAAAAVAIALALGAFAFFTLQKSTGAATAVATDSTQAPAAADGKVTPTPVASTPVESALPTPQPAATPQPEPAPKQDLADAEDFRTAQLIDSAEAYTLYLRLHPQGEHAAQAAKLSKR